MHKYQLTWTLLCHHSKPFCFVLSLKRIQIQDASKKKQQQKNLMLNLSTWCQNSIFSYFSPVDTTSPARLHQSRETLEEACISFLFQVIKHFLGNDKVGRGMKTLLESIEMTKKKSNAWPVELARCLRLRSKSLVWGCTSPWGQGDLMARSDVAFSWTCSS